MKRDPRPGNGDWETGLFPIKHEDLPRIIDQKIAAELIRLRFEMTALRQVLERRSAPGLNRCGCFGFRQCFEPAIGKNAVALSHASALSSWSEVGLTRSGPHHHHLAEILDRQKADKAALGVGDPYHRLPLMRQQAKRRI